MNAGAVFMVLFDRYLTGEDLEDNGGSIGESGDSELNG